MEFKENVFLETRDVPITKSLNKANFNCKFNNIYCIFGVFS